MKKSEVQVGKWYYYEFGYGIEKGVCVSVGEDQAIFRDTDTFEVARSYCRIIATCPTPEPPKPNWLSRLWSRIFG